ncbi:MAG: hypothetical protein HY744_28115 [Deltaproteobacteria bacterium]|nr:hypothetical protein [Deltaproteobacteria bacterium]
MTGRQPENKDGTPEGEYDPVRFGPQDLGACAESAAEGDDKDCLWQEGWFTYTIQGQTPITICLMAKDCETDMDCPWDCEDAAKDCAEGEECTDGKCMKGDKPGGTTLCKDVAQLGKKYCVDHEPNLPEK